MRKGFTLIELLLYTALIAVVLGTIVPLAMTLIQGGTKSGTQQEVYSVTRYIGERLMYEIRNANDIYVASSSFDVNLATTTGAKLSLKGDIGLDPTIIDVASGSLRITEGTSSPVVLNSVDTAVSNLTFTNYSTGTLAKSVEFVLVMIDAATTTRQEYGATSSMRGGAELRSH